MIKRLKQIAWIVFLVCITAGFGLPAAAADWKKGVGAVDSVDTLARTITLDEEVYLVPKSSRIHRESGVRMTLSELRVAIRPGVMLVPMNDVDYVRYEAIQKRRGWEMVEITVLDEAPE